MYAIKRYYWYVLNETIYFMNQYISLMIFSCRPISHNFISVPHLEQSADEKSRVEEKQREARKDGTKAKKELQALFVYLYMSVA